MIPSISLNGQELKTKPESIKFKKGEIKKIIDFELNRTPENIEMVKAWLNNDKNSIEACGSKFKNAKVINDPFDTIHIVFEGEEE